MADSENFLMQFDIDMNVVNAAPTQKTIDQIIKALGEVKSAAARLKATNEVTDFFKSIETAAKAGSAAAQRAAAALKEVGAIKIETKQQIDDQDKLQKSFDATRAAARYLISALNTIGKARSFQGMSGMADKLAQDSERVRVFREELARLYKSGESLSNLKVPTNLGFKGGQEQLKKDIAEAEAAATTPAEKRLAVYQAINRAIVIQASAMGRLSVSAEVTAANRLAQAFSNVVRQVQATSAEMSVLIDRSKRVKVPTDTGRMVNSRVAFAQTVLGTMRQDPGTAANFQLEQQKVRVLAEELKNASTAAKDAQRSMLELASVRLDLGQKALAEEITASAKSLQALRDELKATAKSGQLLNLKGVALPTLSTPASTAAMRAELEAAAASSGKPAAIAAKQYEIINRYLTEEVRLLNEATAAGRKQAETASATAAALKRANGIHGNFYPLIVSAGLFAGLSRATLGFAGASIKMAADYQQSFAAVARTTSTKGHDTQLQIDNIRKALIDLSTQVPISFQDLSKVATAGNQLGIAAKDIPQFTKTISEFSAITGQNSEETAKSFGSLIQILHLGQNEYNNLASSVTLVGRKSVATETEVLAMTTRLGAIATVAGFSASQTVGLGAALSSLREPVERSQGALTTYTKVVDAAAAAGGSKFQKFADVLHITAEQAQKLLRTDPYTFFRKFLDGLSQLDAISKTAKLGDLGLGNVRVSEVLNRLSDNLTIVDQTQQDAAKGFKAGTDLSQQYAKATDTLAANFKELQNAVANLLASFGNSQFTAVLGSLVEMLKNIVVGVTDFVGKNPQLATFALAISAIAGAFALLRGAMIAVAIASFALDSAMTRVTAGTTVGSLTKLVALMFGVRTSTEVATVATQGQAVAEGELTAATDATTVAATRGAIAWGVFTKVLMMTGIGLAVAALGSLLAAVQDYNDSVSSSFNQDDLATALEKDTAEYHKNHTAIRLITGEYPLASTSAKDYAKEVSKAAGATADLTSKTADSVTHLKKQRIAFGLNAEAAMRSDLANNTAFQGLFSKGNADGGMATLQKTLGFDPAKFADIMAAQGAKAARKYVQGFSDKANYSQFLQNQDALQTLFDITDQYAKKEKDAAGSTAAKAAAHRDEKKAIDDAAAANWSYIVTLDDMANYFAKVAKKSSDFVTQVNGITSMLFSGANAYAGQSSALEQMGKDFAESGSNMAFAGQGVQSYITAVAQGANGDPQKTADGLQEMVNAMVAGGYVTGPFAKSLQFLNAEIGVLGGSTDKKKANIDFFVKGLAEGQKEGAKSSTALKTAAQKTADALDKQAASAQKAADRAHDLAAKAQEAAAAFRTTADYSNDLNTVLQGAFDIQFAPQQTRDTIASTFNDMRKSADDAQKSIKDARKQIEGINADMMKLQSDNLQKSYFLGIAQAFGDTVGAAGIQSDIAKNNSDLRDKQASKADSYKQIGDAYAQMDTATTGSSEAAIRNRAALTGLVGNYQQLIANLATSGLNQKQLAAETDKARKNFVEQATALGFSKRQLTPYTKAMDGFVQIIKKVPRKVSVEVKSNVSPAQNALNQFYAKLKLDNAAKAAEAAAKFKDNYAKNIQKAAQDARKKANDELAKIGTGVKYHVTPISALPENVRDSLRYQADSQRVTELSALAKKYAASGAYRAAEAKDAEIARLIREMKALDKKIGFHGSGGGFASGGYTGAGGLNQPAGLVHKGEYVIPKYLVNQSTGLPYADALGRLVQGIRTQSAYAGGGFVNPEMMVVEPGPKFMRELQKVVQTEVAAVIEPRAIAGANQDYLSHQRRRGSSR